MISNVEEFMTWMAQVLEPLCDADPATLAKYIFALLKKHRHISDELQTKLVELLEIFLNRHTQSFVNQLFEKIKKDHPNADFGPDIVTLTRIKEEPLDEEPEPVEETSGESLTQKSDDSDDLLGTTKSSTESSTELEIEAELEFLSKLSSSTSSSSGDLPPQVVPAAVVQPLNQDILETEDLDQTKSVLYASSNGRQSERHSSTSHPHDRRSDAEREEGKGERGVREREGRRSPVRRSERSRSRSWDRRASRRSHSRSRRSRSRGRDRDRSRPFRNKSPPPSRSLKSFDRDRRMHSFSKSPPARSSRSHTPPSKSRSRYSNRSPFTRSPHSPYDSPRHSSVTSPVHESSQSSQTSQEDDLRSLSMHSVVSKLVRCKDFDEKGFCMRGEMCPYDHGKDPMVLEDLGQVLTNYSAPAIMNPVSSGLRLPPPIPGQKIYRAPVHANLSEYNPDAPSMEPRLWVKQPFRTTGRPMLRSQSLGMIRAPIYTGHQRELIRVPMEDQEAQYFPTPSGVVKKRAHPMDYSNEMEGAPPVKQRFDYNRLGHRSKLNNNNCSLILKKIPSGLNNIAHLHNHFVKFGSIVRIQICFEGDPEAALITFTSNAEASAAYKSTEAVLNNRFIKVFWYNPETNNKPDNVMLVGRTPAKDRLGAPVVNPLLNVPQATATKENQENETQKVMFSGSNITKTVYTPFTAEKKPPFVNKPDPKKMLITTHNFFATQEAMVAKEVLKKKEETRKEGLKLTQNITSRKHDLLESLVQEYNLLEERLEKGDFKSSQKAEIFETMRTLQEHLKTLKTDLRMATVGSASKPTTSAIKVTPQLVKKSREATTKQILDAELDLFNRQQEGKDVSELQIRVQELKNKEQSLNMLGNNVSMRPARGAARYRSPRGRGGFNPHTNVDHRPTKLLVSGFESDDKVEVFEHFSNFGEVADHIWDEATPALVIQYKTRKEAENAMAQGRNFQDRLMSVTWFNPAQNMNMRSSSMRSVVLLNESEMIPGQEEDDEESRNLEANEDFLLGEEEEDEEDERTWRR